MAAQINLVKDPRYGRNSELPGEDPYLSGELATAYVRGIQQHDKRGRLKARAYLKHYSAYSKEGGRFRWNANVTPFDWYDPGPSSPIILLTL